MNEQEEILIADWFRRARESQLIHYVCESHFRKLHLALGIPTIILSTIVGTAVFISLDNQSVGHYKVFIGMFSMTASVLAALHTFLGFSQRSQKHRDTATGYASVRREIELMKTFPSENSAEMQKKLESIRTKMDHLSKTSEPVPERIWKKNESRIKGKDHNRIFNLSGQ